MNINKLTEDLRMKVGIIGAMDEEIQYLHSKLEQSKEINKAGCFFIEGTIEKKEIVLLKSGIGKVNAAMATTILHEQFKPDAVINIGSAGGVDESLNVGDVVIAKEVVYHDVDVTPFQYSFGQVPQMPETFQSDSFLLKIAKEAIVKQNLQHAVGLIATGDTFMENERKIARVKKIFPEVLALEMEGAAIAQVCYQYNTPFIITRALSDIAGKESTLSFEAFLDKAAKNSIEIVLEMLKQMK